MAAGASFEEFYAATVDRLLGHLFLVTGDLHAAEEIVEQGSRAERGRAGRAGPASATAPGWRERRPAGARPAGRRRRP